MAAPTLLPGSRLTTNLRALPDAQRRQVAEGDAGTPDHEQLKLTLAQATPSSPNTGRFDAGGDPQGHRRMDHETTAIRTATRALLTAKPTTNERMSEEQISLRFTHGLAWRSPTAGRTNTNRRGDDLGD